MLRYSIFILSFFISVSAFGQRKKKKTDEKTETQTTTTTEIKKPVASSDSIYTTIFRTGMKYGDYQVAAGALYHLMALQPQNESLKDSLVLLYNGMGSSVQAVLIAREILQNNPNNLPVLNAKAHSEQRLGLYKEALASFELLYDKSQNLYDLYQVASLQYALKRYPEAKNTLGFIIRNPNAAQQRITIAGSNQSEQDVTFRAAAHNLMGVVSLEMKDYTAAQNSFKKALEAEPEFELAQNNLNILTTEMNKQKSGTTNKKTGK